MAADRRTPRRGNGHGLIEIGLSEFAYPATPRMRSETAEQLQITMDC